MVFGKCYLLGKKERERYVGHILREKRLWVFCGGDKESIALTTYPPTELRFPRKSYHRYPA